MLAVGSIVVATWLFSLAAKAAGVVGEDRGGVLLLAIGVCVAVWEVGKVRNRARCLGSDAVLSMCGAHGLLVSLLVLLTAGCVQTEVSGTDVAAGAM